MKKLFLSFVVAMMGATTTFAQSSLLATLSSNGNITTYYGADALRNAHANAKDGDIITLSSGSFTAVNIEKGITIRGAGMDVDPATQSEPTIIVGNFSIGIPETSTSPLTIEGIYSNYYIRQTKVLRNATFLKCRISELFAGASTPPALQNITMIHCKITKELVIPANSTVSCLNCVIWNPRTYVNSSNCVYEMTNCILQKLNASSEMWSSTFKNCIFVGTNNSSFHNNNTMYNCVLATDDTSFNHFKNISNTTNKVVSYDSVFKTCKDGTYSDSENFELTDNAVSEYKGTDGTQVGIYGGNMPFNPVPSNPRITKCDVASKSTADGKLSVDITVEGAE